MKLLTAMEMYFAKNQSAYTEMRGLKYWDDKRTVESNGKRLKLSKYKASNIQKKYGLKSKPSRNNHEMWGDVEAKKLRISALLKLGYSAKDIGRLLNVTRTRIYNIIRYKSKRRKS